MFHLFDFTTNNKLVLRQTGTPWENYHLGTASASLLQGKLMPLKEWSTFELAALPSLGAASAKKIQERGHLTEYEIKKTEGYLLP